MAKSCRKKAEEKMRILIVEDEAHLAEALTHILKKHNYTVDSVYDGEAGLDYALSNIYDVIVLDIMLPKMDGISIVKRLRREGIDTPVLLLTAKGEVRDKVIGLDSGADDYLAKPFNTEELLARIRAISRRRGSVSADNSLKYGDITLDVSKLSLTCGSKEITLTLKESELLEFLMNNGEMVSVKERIIEKLWGYDSDAEANHVEVYISFIRKKLKYVGSKVAINTVRGIGYSLSYS